MPWERKTVEEQRREFAEAANGCYEHIYAFQPNPKNFRKLCKNTEQLHDITAFNAAAWNEDTVLHFTKNEGRMSQNSAKGEVGTTALSVDNAIEEQVTLIKSGDSFASASSV